MTEHIPNNIIELEDLTQEELSSVMRLIDKFRKRHGSEKPLEDNKTQVGRQEPRQQEPVPIELNRPARAKGRSKSKYEQAAPSQRGNKRRGSMARTEPVRLKNVNQFLNMDEKDSHKSDSQTDKLLWGNRTPSQRNKQFEPVEVQCKQCMLFFDVNPNIVLIDPDTNKPNFTCNNCASRSRNNVAE